jgi:hypothetical protein
MLEDDAHNLYVVGAWNARLEEGHCGWLTGLDGAGTTILSGPAAIGPRLSWPLDRLPAGFAGVTERYPEPRRLTALNIESTAFQVTFTREMLRTTRLPAREVHPDHDKVTRARSLAARYEAGTVFHLRGAAGIDALEMPPSTPLTSAATSSASPRPVGRASPGPVIGRSARDDADGRWSPGRVRSDQPEQ